LARTAGTEVSPVSTAGLTGPAGNVLSPAL
jgi:hypothetical protein